jgi:hypothetical protein
VLTSDAAGLASWANANSSGVDLITDQTIAGAKTFSAAPVLSTTTASQALFTDANKNIVSNAITGTGNVVMSNAPTFTGTVSGIEKSMVGLDSVDNTSDENKPVSTATQTALDLKAPLDSPTFSGTPSLPSATTAVTQSAGDNSTKLATTAFVTSATQNFFTRITTAERDSIDSPVAGLTVWNTTNTQLEVYDGSYWRNMLGILVSPLKVGDSYGGGKVFYIFTPSDAGYFKGQTHGLIASENDQTSAAGIRWFPGPFFGATATNLGTGIANTALIMVVATAFSANVTSYAAGLANSCKDGGYFDWFLPSRDELNKLYEQRAVIGNFGTTDPFGYWSSSQKGQLSVSNYMNGITSAHFQRFNDGFRGDTGLDQLRRVRAIRIF